MRHMPAFSSDSSAAKHAGESNRDRQQPVDAAVPVHGYRGAQVTEQGVVLDPCGGHRGGSSNVNASADSARTVSVCCPTARG